MSFFVQYRTSSNPGRNWRIHRMEGWDENARIQGSPSTGSSAFLSAGKQAVVGPIQKLAVYLKMPAAARTDM
jgi:hypothetical protein